MLTGALALLHRALRLDSRLISAHLMRFLFALLLYFSLIFAQIQSLGLAAAPGLKLFETMMMLNVALIVLAGISFFATAITEEKEEETLGLLKMAGLNPLSLLLGKSTSRLINTLLLLAVQFPFTLLAVTLGGATITQILAGYASLAAFLILAANVGLLASVACRRGGTASWCVMLFFLFYFTAEPVLSTLGTVFPNGGTAGLWNRVAARMAEASVWTRREEIVSTGFGGPIAGFQVWSNCALALICFLLSWGSFNYFTNPRRLQSSGPDLSSRLIRVMGARRPRPHAYPVMWKEYHFVTGGTRFLIARFFAYMLLMGGALTSFVWIENGRFQDTAPIVSALLLVCVIVEACFYASRLLHDEWREHTLPMLLMLPVPVHRILLTKLAGCVPALLPGLVCLVISLCFWDGGIELFLNSLFLPSHWLFGILFLLMLTLTMFFSLVVRWGALPLAIAVMLGAGVFGTCCWSPAYVIIMRGSDGSVAGREAACAVIDAILLLLILALQFDIQRRLEIAASQ